MSRTSRLFQLMDALRAHRRPVSASSLGTELSVSVRTIYRDVQTLIELGAPIEGEAGIGYLLRAGFFLPPLMFDEDELEALVLGARWVRRQGDAALAEAADKALAKIGTASNKDLRDRIAETGLWPITFREAAIASPNLRPIREAIRREFKIGITYINETGAVTERVVWPIGLAFYEGKRILAAWCEMRSAFRHFRADRIRALTPTEDRYPKRRSLLMKEWSREMKIPETGPG
jgi:predicted DNA-binding transcriptional regulator YafY